MTHKKNLQAPTRAHDLTFLTEKNLTHFISKVYSPNTFPKLPVHALINDPLPKKSYRHQLGPMTYFLTTQKFDPLLHINLENIKVGQISFLNVAMFKSAQVPWTYFLLRCFHNRINMKLKEIFSVFFFL